MTSKTTKKKKNQNNDNPTKKQEKGEQKSSKVSLKIKQNLEHDRNVSRGREGHHTKSGCGRGINN